MWHENLKTNPMRRFRQIKYLLMAVFSAGLLQGLAQAPSKFYMRFGGSGYDDGYDLKQTLDKGYIVAGSTSSFGQGNTDVYLVKLDSMGNIKWQQTYGGYNNETARSVVQLADSGYVAAGYTNSWGFGGYDVYMVRADKAGNLLWQKTFGGADWDFAYGLRQTSDGGFVMCGTTYSYGRGRADGYVIKTDASGNVQWTKTYGGTGDDEFKGIVQTSDGGYAAAGYTKSYADPTNGDAWIFKLGVAGDSTWCQFHGGPQQDYANDVIQHTTGEYYMAGATASFGLGMLDAYALKLTNTGTLIWHQEDGHPSTNEEFYNVTVPLFNSTYTAYAEKDNVPGYDIQPKIMILNAASFYYNATGYGDVTADELYKIVTTKDKGFACVGYTYGFNAQLVDVFFVKTDSTLLGSPNVTSTHDLAAQEPFFSMYPNPVRQTLHIYYTSDKLPAIGIYDIMGKEISCQAGSLKEGKPVADLDLSFLEDGIYFVKVGKHTQKVIVSK